jgi:hypothetical protein
MGIRLWRLGQLLTLITDLVGIPYYGGFGWNNAFMVMDLDGAIHSVGYGGLDTGDLAWWTWLWTSDGIITY